MKSVATITMNPAIDVSTSVDRMTPVHKLCCANAQHDPGGGGINVARIVQKLGGAPPQAATQSDAATTRTGPCLIEHWQVGANDLAACSIDKEIAIDWASRTGDRLLDDNVKSPNWPFLFTTVGFPVADQLGVFDRLQHLSNCRSVRITHQNIDRLGARLLLIQRSRGLKWPCRQCESGKANDASFHLSFPASC
ncbi:MAG: hypothetical protein Q8M24_06065 [Pseudolabrys sp.]|nr:hypothetical protein [Pseudolabrys sp.]MDP2295012.1 hypothetical protein [Pseudolabrys sp.]